MHYGSYLANGLRILRLDRQAVAAIRDNPHVSIYGWITLFVLSVLGGLGAMWLYDGLQEFVLLTIGFLTASLLFYGAAHLISRLLGGATGFGEFIGTLAALSVPVSALWVCVFSASIYAFGAMLTSPYAGWLLLLIALMVFGAWLYVAILQVFTIRETHQFQTWRAVVAWIVPVVVLTPILGFLFLISGMGPHLGY